MNGIGALQGGLIPPIPGALPDFLGFTARPSIRLAALMAIRVLHVLTA